MIRHRILYVTTSASLQSGAFRNLLYMSREIEKHGYRSIPVLPEDGQDSPRRVLYATTSASPQSGAFRMLLAMARGIKSKGYDSVLVLPKADESYTLLTDAEHERVYFLQLPQARRGQSAGYYIHYILWNIQSVYKLVGIIHRERVSIVHINEIFDIYAALAARIAGVPCVWHVRAELSLTPVLEPLLPRITTLLSNAIVAVSESVYRHVFQDQGIDSRKVSVIYDPGPDSSRFHSGVDDSSVREKFGLDGAAFLVALVAKLSKRKGHETLVRAAPKVLASFPNTYFMIVGGELNGDRYRKYARRLRALPRELGIQDRVIFTGLRSDIPQIMAASDIITHCSTYPDPFPGVVLQGMALGKPVIASNLGGPREQIKDQVSGLLVEPGNPTALAEAICSLLEDEEKRASLGKAAASRAKSTFTSELYFQKLSDLYERLIS